MEEHEIKQIALLCDKVLDLTNARPPSEYYQSLPLCIIDAVFSINSAYKITTNTVDRFCEHFSLAIKGKQRRPLVSSQLSVAGFIGLYRKHGSDMTNKVYKNRQRTSTYNGILKSEAVLQFAEVCHKFHVNYLQDIDVILSDPAFENEIMKIPGQNSGVSLRYFYKLTVGGEFVKPDRMIRRFIQCATGRLPNTDEAQEGILGAHKLLVTKYPHLMPSVLDTLIWKYQRNKKKRQGTNCR